MLGKETVRAQNGISKNSHVPFNFTKRFSFYGMSSCRPHIGNSRIHYLNSFCSNSACRAEIKIQELVIIAVRQT